MSLLLEAIETSTQLTKLWISPEECRKHIQEKFFDDKN